MVATPPPPPPGNYPPQPPPNWGNYSPQPPEPKKRGWLVPALIVGGVIVLALILAIVLIAVNSGDDDKKPTPVPTLVTTTAPATVDPVPTTTTPEDNATDPTTEAPTPTSTSFRTPSFIKTENEAAFVAAIRSEPEMNPTDSLSDSQVMTLGVATCVILKSNNGDAAQTVLDVRKAASNKLSLKGTGYLLGASQAGLCPSVELDMSGLSGN